MFRGFAISGFLCLRLRYPRARRRWISRFRDLGSSVFRFTEISLALEFDTSVFRDSDLSRFCDSDISDLSIYRLRDFAIVIFRCVEISRLRYFDIIIQ